MRQKAERRITIGIIALAAFMAFAVASAGYLYLSRSQVWTSSVVLAFKNPASVNGYAIDGSKTEDVISELKSTTVITNAAGRIGNDEITPNQLADSLKIEEIIPALEIERKDSAMKNGLEYEYFPTEYNIQYTIEEERNIQKELYIIMEAFFENYAEKHIKDARIPANSMISPETISEPYWMVEQIGMHVDEMIAFLTEQAEKYPHYRAVGTGLSYLDLLHEYQYVKDWKVAGQMAAILNEKIAKNPDLILTQFRKQIALNEDLEVNYKTDMEQVVALMESYSDKNKIKGSYTRYESDTDNHVDYNRDSVLDELYENTVRPRTAYDTIVDKYKSEGDQVGTNKQENIYLTYLISIFSGSTSSATDKIAAIESNIKNLKHDLVELYDKAFRTDEEHREVLGSDSICLETTPTKTQKYRVKLYVLILFIGVFSMASIGLLWIRSLYVSLNGKKEDPEIVDNETLGLAEGAKRD